MFRMIFQATAITVGLLWAFSSPAEAQKGGGGGGGRAPSGGGGRAPSGSGGGSRPSFAPARAFAPSISGTARSPVGASNYRNAYYYHNNAYRLRYPYLYPFFYPSYFGYTDYSSAPFAFGYAVPGSFLYDSTPPAGSPPPGYPAEATPFAPGPLPTPDDSEPREAVVEVVLPTDDAEVLLEGQKTNSTGARRIFTTPPLAAGAYTYRVTAIWNEDGQEIRAERTVSLVPGRTILADFRKINTSPRMPPVD